MRLVRNSVAGLVVLTASIASIAAQNPPPPNPPAAKAPMTGQGQIIQQIIVKVNGDIFTKTELEQRQIQALQQQNKLIQSPQDLQNDAAMRAARVDMTTDILVKRG